MVSIESKVGFIEDCFFGYSNFVVQISFFSALGVTAIISFFSRDFFTLALKMGSTSICLQHNQLNIMINLNLCLISIKTGLAFKIQLERSRQVFISSLLISQQEIQMRLACCCKSKSQSTLVCWSDGSKMFWLKQSNKNLTISFEYKRSLTR